MSETIHDLALSRADLSSDLDFGAVDLNLIASAESELGAVFPLEYRDYLASYSGGLLLGWEMYGIPTEQSNYPPELELPGNPIIDIVGQNQQMKNPAGTIEFTSDGGGFFFAFIPKLNANAVFVRGYGTDWSLLLRSFHEMLERIADDTIHY